MVITYGKSGRGKKSSVVLAAACARYNLLLNPFLGDDHTLWQVPRRREARKASSSSGSISADGTLSMLSAY